MIQPSKILWFAFSAATLLLLVGRASAQNYVTPTVATTPPAQGQLIVVNNGPGIQTQPHVDGDLVCYTDDSTGTSLIRYFNLATQARGIVPTNVPFAANEDFLCDVRGTTIVFTRSIFNAGIFAFDTSIGGQPVEIAPTTATHFRFVGQIGDQTIAWEDFVPNSAINAAIVA
jgi:hypothetical protein